MSLSNRTVFQDLKKNLKIKNMNLSKPITLLLLLTMLFSSLVIWAQNPPFESMKNFIQPAKKNGGFKMDDYFFLVQQLIIQKSQGD